MDKLQGVRASGAIGLLPAKSVDGGRPTYRDFYLIIARSAALVVSQIFVFLSGLPPFIGYVLAPFPAIDPPGIETSALISEDGLMIALTNEASKLGLIFFDMLEAIRALQKVL